MVETGISPDVVERSAGTGLHIGCPEHDLGDSRLVERPGTHWARFEGDDHRGPIEPPRPGGHRGITYREQLSVSGWVVESLSFVVSAGNDLTVDGHDRPDRHVAVLDGAPSLLDGDSHKVVFVVVGHGLTLSLTMTTGLQNDWQAKAKRVFIVPLMGITIAVLAGGIVGLAGGGVWNWWGPVIAAVGMLGLFGQIALTRFRRINAAPALVAAVVGTAIGFAGAVAPGILATASLGLALLYILWYSPNGRTQVAELAVGAVFPDLEFRDLHGVVVRSTDWRGRPAIVLFYRGNWCPLCNVQVKELASGYRDIEATGARVILISPQSVDHSRDLAAKFEAPMTFLVDHGNAAARRLGIQHPGGTPLGLVGYDSETVLPTAIVLDAAGVVRFSDQTDNYRFRPDPALFMEILTGF